MKKIEFSNNREFVEQAKAFFTDDYKLAYDVRYNTCRYRMADQDGCERRCLIGRLFYGHIPENHAFWDHEGSIQDAFRCHPILQETFPWMNSRVAFLVQETHDYRAGIYSSGKPSDWDFIGDLAYKADLGLSKVG